MGSASFCGVPHRLANLRRFPAFGSVGPRTREAPATLIDRVVRGPRMAAHHHYSASSAPGVENRRRGHNLDISTKGARMLPLAIAGTGYGIIGLLVVVLLVVLI